jgi:pyruvate dehydrogenase E1 component alpha subunit
MGTGSERHSANPEFFKRGDLIPGIKANGMDVLSVLSATKFVKDWATSGKGPILFEVATYRFSGHSVSDPGTTYRTKVNLERLL